MRLVEWRDGLNAPWLIDDRVEPIDLGTALVRQAVHEGYRDFILVGLRRDEACGAVYFACRVFSRPRPRHVLNDVLENAQSYVNNYLCGVSAAN